MTEPLLVLDVHFLAHRAFHTSGHLSYKGFSTGVTFGFLKSIATFKNEFQTDRIVFCFEGQKLKRKTLYPDYKRKRHAERSEVEKAAYTELGIQINQIRCKYLPAIGFANIFQCFGYESDDVMAAIAMNADDNDRVILVTADSDLYQCLRENVSVYSPTKDRLFTLRWFTDTYGFHPSKWALVKAIAGCQSDGVKGIPGVGEVTAVKFVQQKLQGPKSNLILSRESREIVRRNRSLVQLPFKDCPVPEIQRDKVTRSGWEEVCKELGMKSLTPNLPLYRPCQ